MKKFLQWLCQPIGLRTYDRHPDGTWHVSAEDRKTITTALYALTGLTLFYQVLAYIERGRAELAQFEADINRLSADLADERANNYGFQPTSN